MGLPVRDIKESPTRLDYACYLFVISDPAVPPHNASATHLINISAHVFSHVVFGIPQRAVEHGVKRSLSQL